MQQQETLLTLQRDHLGHWYTNDDDKLVFDAEVPRSVAEAATGVEDRIARNQTEVLRLAHLLEGEKPIR
jgi:hypothetical protein